MPNHGVSLVEAARHLQVSQSALYTALQKGQIRTITKGRRRTITSGALQEYKRRLSSTSSIYRL